MNWKHLPEGKGFKIGNTFYRRVCTQISFSVSSAANQSASMNIENGRGTEKKVWLYRDGTIATLAIILFGFVLQAASGGTLLRLAGFPWNMVAGIAFTCLIFLIFFKWKKRAPIKWLGSVSAALPAILGFTFLVLLMGFVKQDVAPKNGVSRLLGLAHLVQTWPFILINVYLLVLLGVVTLKRLRPFTLKNAGFFLNHCGLFLVLFSTALGGSDMQRLTMNCHEGRNEELAADASGRIVKLPFSIRLIKFNIDEFRPKIAIVETNKGQYVPEKGNDQFTLLDRNNFEISQYHVEVDQFLETSGKSGDGYLASTNRGSSPSAKLKVTNRGNQAVFTGWVCSGSFNMPPEVLKLNDNHSLVMLPPEPRKFSSELAIQTKNARTVQPSIEVNKPCSLEGWNIYQLGYDTDLGRWSDMSVLELVRDPWLPVVYAGIFMMMAGAGFLFIYGKPKNGGTKHVA